MKIEKGIPFRKRSKHGEINIVLQKMEVGESVLMLKDQTNAARQIATRFGKKVAVRNVSEKESRLWIIG